MHHVRVDARKEAVTRTIWCCVENREYDVILSVSEESLEPEESLL